MKSTTLVLIAVNLSIGFLAYVCGASRQPSVKLRDGTVVNGVLEIFESSDIQVARDVSVYYGIPYAEAPVGSLRFKAPVPLKNRDNPYNASTVGKSCHQPDIGEIFELVNQEKSEDCLFLDVFVPRPKQKTRPVLVWIHGGMLLVGAGQMPSTSVLPLAAYGDIIVITINYRLGVLGFLTSADDLIPGNLGLKDQQLALKWIHENIEAFGGDPSRITIMGQGAGSACVGYHVLSPSSNGLFKNAIMESGAPNHPLKRYLGAIYHRKEIETLAKLVGCSEEDIRKDERLLSCLQTSPAEGLLQKLSMAQQELGRTLSFQIETIVDGDFIPTDVTTLLNNGAMNAENLILGHNADEGTMQIVSYFQDAHVKPVINSTTFSHFMSLLGLEHPVLQEIIKTVYATDSQQLGNEDRDLFTEISRFFGDYMVICGGFTFARAASSSHANVYRYNMTFKPTNTLTGATWVGASHGDELQYVFGGPFEERLYKKTTDEEKEFSRKAMTYWSNFVKTGDPNKGYEDEERKLPWWPKMTRKDDLYKDLSSSMDVRKNKKHRECHLIDNILPALKKALDELDKLKREKDESSKWSAAGQCVGDNCHTVEGGGS